MIISIDNGKVKKHLPYKNDFKKWREKLSDDDYYTITNALNEMIDGNEVHTAGWMPGSNWMGTVYEPIYHACGRNETVAALFFGLIVYKVFMERPDTWACGRFQLNGKDIKSLTYFLVNAQ